VGSIWDYFIFIVASCIKCPVRTGNSLSNFIFNFNIFNSYCFC